MLGLINFTYYRRIYYEFPLIISYPNWLTVDSPWFILNLSRGQAILFILNWMPNLLAQTNLGTGWSFMGFYGDRMNHVCLSLVFAQLTVFMLRGFVYKLYL